MQLNHDPIKEYSEEEPLAEWPEEELDEIAYQNWIHDQQLEDEIEEFEEFFTRSTNQPKE